MARMTMSHLNTSGVVANLRQYGQRVVQQVQRINAETLTEAYGIAQALCPYDRQELDDFHMIDVMRARLSPNGLAWELGFDASDFRAAGQPSYFIYTEFGTVKMAAQPCIFPARDQVTPRYRLRLRDAVRVQ